MRQIASRLVIFLLSLTLLGWLGYHLVSYNATTVDTETVFKETVFKSVSGRGIAIRDEQILQKTGNGAERFLYEDGTRIGIGQAVVEYYSGSVENRNVQNIDQYKQEILMLREAQNPNANNFTTAGIISRDIREQLAALSTITSTGKCTEVDKIKVNLTQLVNRRDIAIGNSLDYQDRINELEAELETLSSVENLGNIQKGIAPVSGFFVKSCDGYENQSYYKSVGELKVNNYLDLISDTSVEKPVNNSGKMVLDPKWYFAMSVPSHGIEWIKLGQQVELSFGHIPKPIPGKVSHIVIENNNENAIVVFSSDFVSEDSVNLRVSDVKVSFSQFAGLKINTSSFRFNKNDQGEPIRGVYVLENNVPIFKKIDPIYEDGDFVLSRTYYSDSKNKEYVKLYDNVITKGDVHDGKAMQ